MKKMKCALQQLIQEDSIDSPSFGIVLRPYGDKLAQVVGAEDGGVSGEVVEVVHDDGHEEIEHDEGAEKDEADEVGVRHHGAAARVLEYPGGAVVLPGSRIARLVVSAVQHYVGPPLARRTPCGPG